MQTDNFCLKIGISFFLAFIFLFVGAFSFILTRIKKVEMERSFYFLVADSTHLEASVQVAIWSGGAAYIMDKCVVYSVYFSEEDGERVCKRTPKTKLIERKIEGLYLKTKKQKRKAKIYQTAFDNLYQCIRYLEDTIYLLDEGITHQVAKEKLASLSSHTQCLQRTYNQSFTALANIFEALSKELETISKQTVLASKLRYLQCALADSYLHEAGEFLL